MNVTTIALGFLIACKFCISTSYSQSYVLDHYTQSDGLSINYCTEMIEDNLGFIWITTTAGLNRFDGVSFKKYYSVFADTTTPTGDFAFEIYQDKHGFIWYPTQASGLNRYDPKTGKFKRFPVPDPDDVNPNNNVGYTFCEDKNNLLYMMCEKGLCVYDSISEKFTLIHFKNGAAILPASCREIFFNKDNRLFLGTVKGVFEVDLNKETIILIKGTEEFNANTLEIIEDSKGNLFFGTWGGGLIRYDLESRILMRYGMHTSNPKDGFWIFGDIAIQNSDGKEIIWAPSEGPNMLQFDIEAETFSEFDLTTYFPEFDEVISTNSVMVDKHNIVWICTNYGIVKIDPLRQLFSNASIDSTVSRQWYTTVMSIYHDTKDETGNTIWYSVPSTGIVKYNLLTKTSEWVPISDDIQFEFYASIILRRNENEIWIASNKGLLKYDESKKKLYQYKNIKNDKRSISGNFISDLQLDKKNRLWVSVNYHGFNLYIDSCDCFKQFLMDTAALFQGVSLSDNINDIAMSPDGNLWFARGFFESYTTGLSRINPETLEQEYFYKNKIQSPNFPIDRDVFVTHIDEEGIVWVGYESGLFCFNPKEAESDKKYFRFTLANKLRSSIIYGIEQEGNYLWLAGNNGITILDKEKKVVVRSYAKQDGMISDRVSSMVKGFDNRIFFGDMMTLQFIYATNIQPNKNIPPVYITSVKVLDKEYFENGYNVLFNSEITLRYSQNKITFEFVALNLTNPKNNVYAYMLEGVDNDWIYTSANAVNYNNLDGGKYTFKVKASNDNGIWNNEGDTLMLTIIPPWYKTIWFYIGCVLIFITLLYFAYRIRLAQILRIERLRNKISRDLHDDVGSSLSSINMLSALAKHKLSTDGIRTEEILKRINDTSVNTMENMSDIVWAINPGNDKLFDIQIRMQQYLSNTLEAKNIEYTFTIDENILAIKLPMEIRKDFYLIFKEAVNNLAKYSNATKAYINIQLAEKSIELLIKDNGIGFNLETAKKNNGLNNYYTRAENIHASIQIQSSPEKGTIIKLNVPLG